jgi:membrane glycosyltransferase
MAEMSSAPSNKTTIAMGVLSMAVGVIPLFAMSGILPRGSAPADPAPSWMGWLIGAMFVAAGFIVILRGVLGASDESGALPANAPRPLRLANDILAVGIVCALALLFSWVAFGPGPRHFSVGVAGLWMGTSGAGDAIGRVAFGFCAILIWCVIGAFAVITLRGWRR